MKNKITIIGGGNIGEALISQSAKDVLVIDIDEARLKYLAKKYKVNTSNNIMHCLASEIIILAVKPQQAKTVYLNLEKQINKNTIVISIMAGISIKSISEGLNAKKIVRAMPNTPVLVNKGMTVWFAKNLKQAEKKEVQKIFGSMGMELEVKKEDDIDKATAISGSGPAYVFYFIEAYLEACDKMGLDRKLVRQTIVGSIELLDQSKDRAKTLRKKVTSKKGTTEAATNYLDSKKFKKIFAEAINKAYKRSLEIQKDYE